MVYSNLISVNLSEHAGIVLRDYRNTLCFFILSSAWVRLHFNHSYNYMDHGCNQEKRCEEMKRRSLRKIILAAILFFVTISLTGCWDVKEINRRGIADSILFDIGDSSLFKMGVSMPIPGTQIPPVAGTSQQFHKRHYTISGEGLSVLAAWTEVKSNSARDIFFGQVRAIIISEEAARKNINDILDFVGRVPLLPPNTNILITKQDPAETLDFKNVENFIPGDYVDFYFQTTDKRTLALPINLWRLNSMLDKNWQDPYLPIIELKEDTYRIAGTAVFSGSRMAGELDKDETQTLALIKGTDSGFLNFSTDKGIIVSLYKVKSKTKIEPTISDDGKIIFNLKTKIAGGIVESQPHREITINEKKKIEEEAARLTKIKMENVLSRLQKMNSDPVGLGGKYRIKYPREWQEIDWRQVYPTVNFIVDTEFSIKSTGLFR